MFSLLNLARKGLTPTKPLTLHTPSTLPVLTKPENPTQEKSYPSSMHLRAFLIIEKQGG